MRKCDDVILTIRNSRRLKVEFENLRSTRFHVISARDGYMFHYGYSDMLLPLSSFGNANREAYVHCVNHSRKLVSDMIIIGSFVSNIVGYADYYGSSTGDIFCENGCVYSKSGSIYCVSLVNASNSKSVLVMNKININSELSKCIMKSYTDSTMNTYDELVIGDVMDYIIVR